MINYADNSTSKKSFTYQHLHGTMLVNLNKLAFELKLSHTEYHLMGILIGYWNKQKGKSFPTVKMLAKYSRMSNSTVNKCLKHLSELGLILIVKDGNHGRQNYYLNHQKFLLPESNSEVIHEVTKQITPCDNTHDINKQNNLTNKNNRTFFLKKTIQTNYNNKIEPQKNQSEIKSMLKHKFWRHKKSNRVFQVLPDVGNHILIKYDKINETVFFIDEKFQDKLINFESLIDNVLPFIETIKDQTKPEKRDIIDQLIVNNQEEQALVLSKLWKIKLNV